MPVQLPSDIVERAVMILQVFFGLAGAFWLALWVSIVVWTYRDIKSRTRDVLVQILSVMMVLLFNLPGLLFYFLLRPRETLAEAYEKALEEEALLQSIEERELCPGCGRKVQQDFILCPYCHTKLKKLCNACGRLLHLSWEICPYCGAEQK
jgi:RNA polymerase subunit RPABC4/transcription elongation factor Spt4